MICKKIIAGSKLTGNWSLAIKTFGEGKARGSNNEVRLVRHVKQSNNNLSKLKNIYQLIKIPINQCHLKVDQLGFDHKDRSYYEFDQLTVSQF